MPDGFDPKSGYDPNNVARSITVEIDAPARVVWDVLVDLPKYGEWNSFCVRAESTLKMGDPVNMWIVPAWCTRDEQIPIVEYLCAFEPEKLLSWQMPWSEAWPYAGRRDQVITTLGPETCSYYSTDAFLGDTGIHIMRFAGGWISAGFSATARDLKKRAEAIWAAEKAGRKVA
jgi:hypothetical protein